jgi:hypothetical protein
LRISIFWLALLVCVSCGTVASPSPTVAQSGGTGNGDVPQLLGRELVYAAAYDQDGRAGLTSTLEIGRVEFRADRTFRTTRFVFQPNLNPQPVLSGRLEPYAGKGCVSQRLRIPSYQRSDEFQGSWELTDDELVLSTRDGRDKPVKQAWRVKKIDKKLFALASLSGHADASFHGYAYVSERTTAVPPAKVAVRLQSVYAGEIQQKVIGAGGQWKKYPFGISLVQHQKHSTSTYRYYYTGDGGKTYGFSTLTFNAFRYSRDIFLHTFGTDFNKNGCFDDAGHSTLYWGAEDAKGTVRGAVLIEQSYGVTGAIVSVGQVD